MPFFLDTFSSDNLLLSFLIYLCVIYLDFRILAILFVSIALFYIIIEQEELKDNLNRLEEKINTLQNMKQCSDAKNDKKLENEQLENEQLKVEKLENEQIEDE